MNGLQAWSMSVCMAALGCAAVRLIAPKAGSGKLFGIVVSSFFLCTLILPLSKVFSLTTLKTEWLPPSVSQGMLEDTVTEQLETQVRQAVVRVANEAAQARNIPLEQVEVITDISENGSIHIKQVILYVDKQSVPTATVVKEVLAKQLETTVMLKIKE